MRRIKSAQLTPQASGRAIIEGSFKRNGNRSYWLASVARGGGILYSEWLDMTAMVGKDFHYLVAPATDPLWVKHRRRITPISMDFGLARIWRCPKCGGEIPHIEDGVLRWCGCGESGVDATPDYTRVLGELCAARRHSTDLHPDGRVHRKGSKGRKPILEA